MVQQNEGALDAHTLGEVVKTQLYNKDEEMDVIGSVYEYFLGRFVQQEGKGGGEFLHQGSAVKLLVETIQPLQSRVYYGSSE